MTTPALFDIEGVPAPPEAALVKVSAGTRLKMRQSAAIERRVHPLGLVRPTLAIHPDAMPFPATKANAAERRIRCGTCLFREQHDGFPKCTFGASMVTGNKYSWRDYPRAARSLATDIRGWWPGCTDWKALP